MQQTAKKSIMIQLTVHSNIQVYGAISNPAGIITESGERTKDILVCSATQAGDLAVEIIETVVRDNINRTVRPFTNPIKRFF